MKNFIRKTNIFYFNHFFYFNNLVIEKLIVFNDYKLSYKRLTSSFSPNSLANEDTVVCNLENLIKQINRYTFWSFLLIHK